jgi:hypothetical protein
MTNKLVVILVGLLIILFAVYGFLSTPYYIGKLAALSLPAFTFSWEIPIWLLRIIFEMQKFFSRTIAIIFIFRYVIVFYLLAGLIVLGLNAPKSLNWLAVCQVSYGFAILILLSVFLNWNLDAIFAIAAIPLGITTTGLIRLFWQKGFNKIHSVFTVLIAVLLGKCLGDFTIAAIANLQTVGNNSIKWTTLLFPLFLLQLCLALSLKYQFKRNI